MAGAGDWELAAAWSAEPADDGPAPGGLSPEEELITGRRPRRSALLLQRGGDRLRRLPRPIRLGAAALVGAVISLLLLGRATLDRTTHASPSNAPHTVGRGNADRPTQRSQSGQSLIIAKAVAAAPLVDYTRSTAQPGECAVVPPNTSPTRAVVLAAQRALPGFRIRDIGRTLDQSTGLCALDLRAVDSKDSAVIIEVVAPARAMTRPPFTIMNNEVTSDGTTATSVVSTSTPDGWSITVGAVGPVADQPSSTAMLALTEDASLRW
jgi:hypothetical protein